MPKPLQIDRDLIEYLSELARLNVPSDRQQQLLTQLQSLVDAFSSLAQADLDPASADRGPQTASLTPDQLRPDRPEPTPGSAQVLANAPQTATDCFVVPRVVEP